MRRSRWIAPLVGAALVGLHAAALPLLVARVERPALTVALVAPRRAAGSRLEVAASLPDGLLERATLRLDGQESGPAEKLAELTARDLAPGLHHIEWRVEYRGGIERRVGWSQLTGPYQDPARPPCGARILFGQRLLDDGAAGPGTIAQVVKRLVEAELSGFERWPVGRFERVSGLALDWVGPQPGKLGHLRVSIDIAMASARLGLTVRLTPRMQGVELLIDARTEVRVAMESRVAQWVIDLIDGDELLSKLARRQIAGALDDLLTVPPPLDLGDGRSLELTFCPDRPVEIVSGRHAAIWLAARLDQAAAIGVQRGRGGAPVLLPSEPLGETRPLAAPIAIELDGNALNGLLYALWATGFFEQVLAEAGIVDSFHRDPVVADLLSVRVRGPLLPVPPTVSAARSGDQAHRVIPRDALSRPGGDRSGGRSYELGVASYFWLEDGDLLTPAHLFGRAGFAVGSSLTDVAVSLSELGLTCEPEPGILEPCYPELAAELVARAPDLHDELSDWFGQVLTDLLTGRDLAPGGPARFRIERTDLVPPPAGRHGPLRLELHGRIQE